MKDIAILVEGKYVDPDQRDWYINQVLREDEVLMKQLSKQGLSSEKLDWSASHDLSKYKAVIFSSIWDYFHRFDEFCQFLQSSHGQTTFINSISTIEWNMDKHYLADLEKKGVPTIPTIFIEKGDSRSLKEIIEDSGWSKTVLKPCISGAARHTYKIDHNNIEEVNLIFKQLIKDESMMLQPYMEQITTKGEVSHIVISGEYAHSVLKKAKPGDYRVQDDFGGSVHDYQANKAEVAFAEKAVKACKDLPLYARVDAVWDNNDQLALGELELIEPELWFRDHPESAKMLAAAIYKMIKLEA